MKNYSFVKKLILNKIKYVNYIKYILIFSILFIKFSNSDIKTYDRIIDQYSQNERDTYYFQMLFYYSLSNNNIPLQSQGLIYKPNSNIFGCLDASYERINNSESSVLLLSNNLTNESPATNLVDVYSNTFYCENISDYDINVYVPLIVNTSNNDELIIQILVFNKKSIDANLDIYWYNQDTSQKTLIDNTETVLGNRSYRLKLYVKMGLAPSNLTICILKENNNFSSNINVQYNLSYTNMIFILSLDTNDNTYTSPILSTLVLYRKSLSTSKTISGRSVCDNTTNKCLNNYYCNISVCSKCHSSCLTCTSSASNSCLSCERHTKEWNSMPILGLCTCKFNF